MTPMVPIDFGGVVAMAKLECKNPSGSHKDRVARYKIKSLITTGRISPTGKTATMILSTSGNAGRAFAHHTAGLNVRLILVSDVLSPREHLATVEQYDHVELYTVDDPDPSGSHVAARKKVIARLVEQEPEAIVIDQYGDELFPLAYEQTLVGEIEAQAVNMSAIFLPTGTCATLLAFCRYKHAHGRNWLIKPIDAAGSALFRKPIGVKRKFSGYGNARPTPLLDICKGEYSPPIHIDDVDAARMCWWLWKKQGLYVGPSSGAVAAAFIQCASSPHYDLPHRGHPVLMMSDAGTTYTNTLYNPRWLEENGLGAAIEGFDIDNSPTPDGETS